MTGIAVSVGIFLLILLLGATNGVINAFEKAIGGQAMDVVNVYGSQTTIPFDGLKEGRDVILDTRDLNTASKRFPTQVTNAAAVNSIYDVNLACLDNSVSSTILGVMPNFFKMRPMELLYGRYTNDIDIKERRKTIVITDNCAKKLFPNLSNAVGNDIEANGISYKIVGILKDKEDSRWIQSYIPITTMQTIYKQGITYHSLQLQTKNVKTDEESKAFTSSLAAALSKNHNYSPTDTQAIWTYNQARGAQETNKAMNILRTAVWIIGLLTLLGGIVGVSNIMLITVKERKKEFGIRKALGARSLSILKSVMLESVIITSFFGYIGLILGIAATEYLAYIAGEKRVNVGVSEVTVFLNPTVNLNVAFGALLTLIIAGLLAGFFPARKAVKSKVVEALK